MVTEYIFYENFLQNITVTFSFWNRNELSVFFLYTLYLKYEKKRIRSTFINETNVHYVYYIRTCSILYIHNTGYFRLIYTHFTTKNQQLNDSPVIINFLLKPWFGKMYKKYIAQTTGFMDRQYTQHYSLYINVSIYTYIRNIRLPIYIFRMLFFYIDKTRIFYRIQDANF